MAGTRLVGLCPRCDANQPGTQGLLAYFAIHSAVQPGDETTFAGLLRTWVDSIPAHPDESQWAEDARKWSEGDL